MAAVVFFFVFLEQSLELKMDQETEFWMEEERRPKDRKTEGIDRELELGKAE